MKKMFVLLVALFLMSCSETQGTHYEALFLNQSEVEVLLIWGNDHNKDPDTIMIASGDTSTAVKEFRFPLLQENGLRWSEESSLYDVQLAFYVDSDSSKCLCYTGSDYVENDIRNIKSYENIGEIDIRGNYISEAMLYRITDDMLKEAKPCD